MHKYYIPEYSASSESEVETEGKFRKIVSWAVKNNRFEKVHKLHLKN